MQPTTEEPRRNSKLITEVLSPETLQLRAAKDERKKLNESIEDLQRRLTELKASSITRTEHKSSTEQHLVAERKSFTSRLAKVRRQRRSLAFPGSRPDDDDGLHEDMEQSRKMIIPTEGGRLSRVFESNSSTASEVGLTGQRDMGNREFVEGSPVRSGSIETFGPWIHAFPDDSPELAWQKYHLCKSHKVSFDQLLSSKKQRLMKWRLICINGQYRRERKLKEKLLHSFLTKSEWKAFVEGCTFRTEEQSRVMHMQELTLLHKRLENMLKLFDFWERRFRTRQPQILHTAADMLAKSLEILDKLDEVGAAASGSRLKDFPATLSDTLLVPRADNVALLSFFLERVTSQPDPYRSRMLQELLEMEADRMQSQEPESRMPGPAVRNR